MNQELTEKEREFYNKKKLPPFNHQNVLCISPSEPPFRDDTGDVCVLGARERIMEGECSRVYVHTYQNTVDVFPVRGNSKPVTRVFMHPICGVVLATGEAHFSSSMTSPTSKGEEKSRDRQPRQSTLLPTALATSKNSIGHGPRKERLRKQVKQETAREKGGERVRRDHPALWVALRKWRTWINKKNKNKRRRACARRKSQTGGRSISAIVNPKKLDANIRALKRLLVRVAVPQYSATNPQERNAEFRYGYCLRNRK